MNSDLVVLAKYSGDGASTKSNEDEYGYNIDTERKLNILKVYKGSSNLKSTSFLFGDYVTKSTEPAPTEEENHTEDHYFDLSKIKIGGEYIFFLTKNKETGKYAVTDYVSGVKETDKNLAFYEQNISEIQQIVAAKGNQYALLTEWIVKNIENKETRNDGIGDLAESFAGLSFQNEDPNFKGKGPFVINDGYGVYTVGVAKHLTSAQKERVSAVLYEMLQTAWTAENPQYVNYGVSTILVGMDKSRLLNYTYSILQKTDKTDLTRKRVIMEFLNDSIGDETFSNIYYQLNEVEYEIEEAQKDNSAQGKKSLQDLTVTRDAKYVELEKRFKFMQQRKFVAVAVKES